MFFASAAKLHKCRGRINILMSWLKVGCHVACPRSPGGGAARAVEVGIRGVLRETLSNWVGVGIHVCVRSSSSGRKGGLVGRRAIFEGGIVVVLDLIRIDLRRVRGLIWMRGAEVNVSLVVRMSVTVCDVVGARVSLVDVRLVGTSGRVRRSHGPAERTKSVSGRDWKGRTFCRKVLGKTVERVVDRNANRILQASARSYFWVSFDHTLNRAVHAYRGGCSYHQ